MKAIASGLSKAKPVETRRGSHGLSIGRMGWLACVMLIVGLCGQVQATEAGSADVVAASAPRQHIKLMHIGNSFSWNAVKYLPDLAQAGDKQLTLFDAGLGGYSLEGHARHLAQAKAGDAKGQVYKVGDALTGQYPADRKLTLPEALVAMKWDVITIQQVSHQSFKPESYEPYAGQLVEEIRKLAPQATILVHQTWAYRPDHKFFKAGSGLTPALMHERLSRAYQALADRYGLKLLPSGNAVARAVATEAWRYEPDPGFDYVNLVAGKKPKEKGLFPGHRVEKAADGKLVLRSDTIHLNAAGEYLAGCVWYEILFNDSVLEVDYTPRALTPEQAADLRRIAHETVQAYREHGLLGQVKPQPVLEVVGSP